MNFPPSILRITRHSWRGSGALAGERSIPEETAVKFRAALDDAKVDYAMVYFGGAKHSFTVKGIDEKKVEGLEYNAEADRRSWQYMRLLFDEVFGEKK